MHVILQSESVNQTIVNDYLGLASFFGILITIILSGLSLSLQRRATARESLEQLDDLRIRRNHAKLRPILHKYGWPRRETVVKLKAYKPTDTSGMSSVHPRALALSCRPFQDFSVEPVIDGYELTINSSNPVKIRRATSDLFDNISNEIKNRDDSRWVKFEYIEDHYGDAVRAGRGAIHREILDILGDGNRKKQEIIEDKLSLTDELSSTIVAMALRDLIKWDEIEEENHAYQTKED